MDELVFCLDVLALSPSDSAHAFLVKCGQMYVKEGRKVL